MTSLWQPLKQPRCTRSMTILCAADLLESHRIASAPTCGGQQLDVRQKEGRGLQGAAVKKQQPWVGLGMGVSVPGVP